MIPHLDQLSFWLGFVFAGLLFLLLKFLFPFSKQIQKYILERKERKNTNVSDEVKAQYLAGLYIRAQGLHLASPLFMLDDILIKPKLMAPPARVSPDEPKFTEDFVTSIIPYLPTWPEVAATFNAPTMTITEALSGKSDIVITGYPGTGKSVALAYLASSLAKNPKDSVLPGDTIPFLVDLADINLDAKSYIDPIEQITRIILNTSPTDNPSRISQFIKAQFSEGHALLLLDGTDELTDETLKPTTDFIRSIKRDYPRTKIITTGNPEFLSGLVTLNFIPFTISSWNQEDRTTFLDRWGDNWSRIAAQESSDRLFLGEVHELLLNNWISSINTSYSPFELTLMTWGCYAGDIFGSEVIDSINLHIQRLRPPDVPLAVLESLAFNSMISANPCFSSNQACDWITAYPSDGTIPLPTKESTSQELNGDSGGESINSNKPIQTKSAITRLVENGLLTAHLANRLKFTHVIFSSLLAAYLFDENTIDTVLNHPDWSGKFIALNYYAAVHDAKTVVDKFMQIPDELLERNLLIVASWSRHALNNSEWRVPFIEKLNSLLQISGRPLGFRGQILAAMIQCNDEGVRVLMRHFLLSDDDDLLRLCLLGSAMLKDIKSVDTIAKLLGHKNPLIIQTACLALVTIGTTSAIDFVADALLQGDKDTKKAAAEALANHPTEGHAILREAIELEDFLVRWAVVYGLGRINEFWAKDLLSKLRLEDEQWIVRNAADEILDARLRSTIYIPKRLPPASECPWLIKFASKKGLGITPGKPATEILLMALEEGSEEEQLASLDYLRISNSLEIFPVFYQKLSGGNPILQEAIFRTLREMAVRGVKIPVPRMFEEGKE